jgi:hypothetical protein
MGGKSSNASSCHDQEGCLGGKGIGHAAVIIRKSDGWG